MTRTAKLSTPVAVLATILAATSARAQQKPNILLIMSDDVGVANISAYTHGVVGYKTSNIEHRTSTASPKKA